MTLSTTMAVTLKTARRPGPMHTGRLRCFLGPLHVVGPGLVARQRFDNVFHRRPEVDHLQRVVQPARRDAEVRFVRRHVVNTMVLAGQNQVHVLQYRDVAGKAEIRMGPFVNLKGNKLNIY